VIAIAVVFIVQFGPQANVRTPGGPTCAIEIQGDCINSNHFWAAYHLLVPPGADAARLKQMGLRKQVAEGLIERWLLNQDAKRLGITVSDEDVTAELVAGRARVSLPADKSRQYAYALGLPSDDFVRFLPVKNRQTKKFEVKTYEREIRGRVRMSPDEFRDFQRQEIIAARMRDLARSRVRVGDQEAFAQYARAKSTTTLRYVRLQKSFYADLFVDKSPKAVDAWAEKNPDEINRTWESSKSQFLPECREVRHIFAEIDSSAEDPEAAKANAKKRIEEAAERIKKGDSFAAVAVDLSDGPTAREGGHLGCIAKGRPAAKDFPIVKPFEDAAFSLAAGNVSGIVETEAGYHLIKAERIAKDADAETLGKKQIALDIYLKFESERMAAEGAKEILAAVKIGKSLEDALADHLAALPRPKQKDGAKDKKDGDKATTDKKDGDKKDEGQDDAVAKRRAPLSVDNHPDRPTVETTQPFTALSDPISGTRPGTRVSAIAAELQKPGDVPGDVVPLEAGYAVIQLKERTSVTQEQFEKERDTYVADMRAAKQNDALAIYLQRLRTTLAPEIKQDQSLMAEPKDSSQSDEPPPELPGE
jgi:peptidyl-prolyl cis-trans isomerase D